MKVNCGCKRMCGSTMWSKTKSREVHFSGGVVYLWSDATPEVGVERARLHHGRHQCQVLSHQQAEHAGVGQQVVAVHKLQRHSGWAGQSFILQYSLMKLQWRRLWITAYVKILSHSPHPPVPSANSTHLLTGTRLFFGTTLNCTQ